MPEASEKSTRFGEKKINNNKIKSNTCLQKQKGGLIIISERVAARRSDISVYNRGQYIIII